MYNGNDLVPAWTAVDGGASLNFNSSVQADFPQLASHGTGLYATWVENYTIRVASYNGNDSAPAWTFVDGNTAGGLNRDPVKYAQEPQLAVYNSKLYAVWTEEAVSYHARVIISEYNGNDSAPAWTTVNGNFGNSYLDRINAKDSACWYPQLTASGSRLFAVWIENPNMFGSGANLTQMSLKKRVFVAEYSGGTTDPLWTYRDADPYYGLNKSYEQDADYPQLTMFENKAYVIWKEKTAVRVKVGVLK